MAEKVTIGNCELWHGDCREVLPLLPAHDLLCTDPPYGIGQDGGAQRTRGSKRTNGDKLGWDNERPPAWLFGLMTEKASAAVIWGRVHHPQSGSAGTSPRSAGIAPRFPWNRPVWS